MTLTVIRGSTTGIFLSSIHGKSRKAYKDVNTISYKYKMAIIVNEL